jgi:hypothetical protein
VDRRKKDKRKGEEREAKALYTLSSSICFSSFSTSWNNVLYVERGKKKKESIL